MPIYYNQTTHQLQLQAVTTTYITRRVASQVPDNFTAPPPRRRVKTRPPSSGTTYDEWGLKTHLRRYIIIFCSYFTNDFLNRLRVLRWYRTKWQQGAVERAERESRPRVRDASRYWYVYILLLFYCTKWYFITSYIFGTEKHNDYEQHHVPLPTPGRHPNQGHPKKRPKRRHLRHLFDVGKK